MKLLQPTDNKIEIIVRRENGGGDDGYSRTSTAKTKQDLQNPVYATSGWRKKLFGDLTVKQVNRWKNIVAQHSAMTLKSVAMNLGSLLTSHISMIRGDQAWGSIVSRSLEQVSDITNFAFGSWQGIAIGYATGNVAGAIVGGALNAVGRIVSIHSRDMSRQNKYNFETLKENNNIAYNRARTNINFTTGRLR